MWLGEAGKPGAVNSRTPGLGAGLLGLPIGRLRGLCPRLILPQFVRPEPWQ